MATVTSLVRAAGGAGNPGAKPYLVQQEIDFAAAATAKGTALAAADVITAITVLTGITVPDREESFGELSRWNEINQKTYVGIHPNSTK